MPELNLISTLFVFVIPVIFAVTVHEEALVKSHALPVNLPAGWDHKKVFGQLPATATNAPFAFLNGLLMLFAGLLLLLTRKHVFNV